MDEWESVRQKIKELQVAFLDSSPDVRSTLDTVSIADFWKRRYEQERILWEQKLAVKEREQVKIQEKTAAGEEGIRELTYRVKEMEYRLEKEKSLFEERTKTKSLEAELERKRIEWESKYHEYEIENEGLRQKLREGSESREEAKKRFEHAESEKAKMALEIVSLQERLNSAGASEQKRIQDLERDLESAQKDMELLRAQKTENQSKSADVDKEVALIKAERQKNMQLLEAREKEQFLNFEDMTRGFAHKVRNYLGIVSGTLQLCLANFQMDPELKKQINVADENAQEMLKSIEEFLTLAKIPTITLQPMQMNELLNNVVFTLDSQIQNQNMRIVKQYAENLPAIAVDSKILAEAFKQILSNAIEASPNGATLTLNVSYEPQMDRIVLQFIDPGKGISDIHLKKIYQPYFTNKKGRKGLGLTTAKRAIDLHHGLILVSSAKDQGTTVTVYLPAKLAHP